MKGNPKNVDNAHVQMENEGAKLLTMLSGRDFVVVLDERGDLCTSFDVANIIATAGAPPCASVGSESSSSSLQGSALLTRGANKADVAARRRRMCQGACAARCWAGRMQAAIAGCT